MIKIDPFVETNRPNKFGYWINKKNGQTYGGAYISPLLIPNLEKVEKGFKKAIRNKKFLRGLEEQLLTYIGIIAAVVQILEMFLDKYVPILYNSLGSFLPLITVNCAILGGSLFMQQKDAQWRKVAYEIKGTGIFELDELGCDLTGEYKSILEIKN